MAVTPTARLGLNRWSAGTDPWPARPGWDTQQQKLDDLVAIDLQNTFANRPAAGIRGRYFFATDTSRLYRDTGAAWLEVGPTGGVAPSALAFGTAGVEGANVRAARADHTHTLPAHDDAAHSAVHLNALAPPTGVLGMNGQRVAGLGAPANPTDAATQQTVVDQVAALITAPGTPATITYGAAGAAGVSSKAARADHTHPFPANPWTAYTPTWTASGNAPAIGNGTLQGWYQQTGKLVVFRIRMTMGSTTNYGTGYFLLGYPVTASNSVAAGVSGYVSRSGPAYWPIIGVGFSTTSTRMVGSANNQLVTGVAPLALAAGDELVIGGSYEAA